MKIGRITLAEETGIADRWGPEMELILASLSEEPSEVLPIVVSNPGETRTALLRLCDVEKCPLVVTIGGTGPRPGDILPDITQEILDRCLPGFGDTMRQYSYEKTPLAILSRAVAGVRGKSLVINLPARPKAAGACLRMLREPISECIDQLTGNRPILAVKTVEIPLEKWLPFLKKIRSRPDPRLE